MAVLPSVRIADPIGRLVHDPYRGLAPGGASIVFTQVVRQAFLVAVAAWQVVELAAIAVTPGPRPEYAWLAAGHAAVFAATLLALPRRLPASVPLAASYLVFLCDWWAADSVEGTLLFASCWMLNLTNATTAFAMRGRGALLLPFGAAVALPPAMLITRPDLDSNLPSAVLVTALSIIACTRLGHSYLADFALRADRAEAYAAKEREAVTARMVASRVAAEDARVLHDTVVNTLAALASGGAATRDVDLVRARCARDVATVGALRQGRAELPVDAGSLREAAVGLALELQHDGLEGDVLARAEARLSADQRRALRRTLVELLQNVTNHAGVSAARLEITAEGESMTVRVSDAGVGFDGAVRPGRGLARSVMERAATAGIEVAIDTAPGRGTTVTLSSPLDPHQGGPDDAVLVDNGAGEQSLLNAVNVLRRRAAFMWAWGVAAVGIVLGLTSHPGELAPDFGMVALAAGGCGWAWYRSTYSTLGGRSVGCLALAAAAAFVLTAATVDFGRTDVVLWQAVGPTGLLVLLAELTTPRRLLTAIVLYAGTVLSVASFAARESLVPGTVVVVAGLAGLGFLAGWTTFRRTLGAIGQRAELDQQAASRARIEVAQRTAAELARSRWRDAGLQESVILLRRVANGDIDPDEPGLQSACAAEEAYLRQLILLDPDLVWMGAWLAQALSVGRSRGVRLTVRTGSADLGEAHAAATGRLILDAADSVPPDSDLTISLFSTHGATQVTIVGPHPDLGDLARSWRRPIGVALDVNTFTGTDVVEIRPDAQSPDGPGLAEQ